MSVVCESLEAYKKLVHVDVSGLSWLHLQVFASISSLIVVIMVSLNELIGLRFTLE